MATATVSDREDGEQDRVTVHANGITIDVIANDDGTVYIETGSVEPSHQVIVANSSIDRYKTRRPAVMFALVPIPKRDQPKVLAEVQRVCGMSATIELLLTHPTAHGSGLVIVHAPSRGGPNEWIVWQWATKLTDGSDVTTDSGAMLYNGGYHATREAAQADLDVRPVR